MRALYSLCAILSILFFCKAEGGAIKAAYWPSYTAPYTPISSINTSLFTHLLYAFAEINSTTFHVEPDNATLLSNFTQHLPSSITPLLSIGGGNSDSTLFSQAVSNSTTRQSFIDSSIQLARTAGFLGLNIDWEYPRSEADMFNFAEFLTEWRAGVQKEASNTSLAPLLLTAAVYYSSRVPSMNDSSIRVRYPIDSLNKNLDLVYIMSFDYHGSWENFTGEHAALSGINTNYTTSYGLHQWIADGLTPGMAIVGLATYGRSWTLLNTSSTGIGAPAIGPGAAQPTSKTAGIAFYFEIEDFIKFNNTTVVYDQETSSAYCYNGQMWIGYDDAQTFAVKIDAFRALGFAGYFFWTVSYDVPQAWPLATKASEAWETGKSDVSSPDSYNVSSHDTAFRIPFPAWMPTFLISLLLTWVLNLPWHMSALKFSLTNTRKHE